MQPCEQRIFCESCAYAHHVSVEIPHAPHAIQQIRQRARRQVSQRQLEAVALARLDADPPLLLTDSMATLVRIALDALQPRDRAQPIEREHGLHIERRAIRQLQCEARRRRVRRHIVSRRPLMLAQGARCQAIGLLPRIVEASDARKARRKRDVGDRQRGLSQQSLREQQAARLLHLLWRRT
ncbi:hypothetical protein D3C85_1168160 [compost metagenome]